MQTRHFDNPGDYNTFFEKYRNWVHAIQADAATRRSVIYAAAKAARTERWERYSAEYKAIEAEYKAIEAEYKAKELSFESFQRTN